MPTAPTRQPLTTGRIALSRGGELPLRNRPLVMGVLNVTPDSFSDGGHWLEIDLAVERAEQLVAEGAELIDIGAESTRPGGGVYGDGAGEVPEKEEIRRLVPVVESLRSRIEAPISVDTRKSRVAEIALAAGADLVNDISALSDPAMAGVVASAGCSVVLMHSRGQLSRMQRDISFEDVVIEVVDELETTVDRACDQGVERNRLLVDPGLGFGKRTEHNLELLRRLDALQRLDLPILVGASRKSFIGDLTGAPVTDRLPGSLAAVGWAARHKAAVVRVHDVAATRQFLTLWEAIESASTRKDTRH